MQRIGLLLICLLVPSYLQAAVDDILEAIRQSEFLFARATTEVPLFPVAWMQASYYPDTELTSEDGSYPEASVMEHAFSAGGIYPVFVDRRDMFVVGGDIGVNNIHVTTGPYSDQRILRLTPALAWLHQYNKSLTIGVFVAPMLSQERNQDQPWVKNGYGGVMALDWYSDSLQWLYGGVIEYTYGEQYFYPYVGVQWLPSSNLSLSLIFPWPAISYAPNDDWLLQLKVAPGGSSWIASHDRLEAYQSFGSWNFSAAVERRLTGAWWLQFGAGRALFRYLGIHLTDGTESRLDADSGAIYTLALHYRP